MHQSLIVLDKDTLLLVAATARIAYHEMHNVFPSLLVFFSLHLLAAHHIPAVR